MEFKHRKKPLTTEMKLLQKMTKGIKKKERNLRPHSKVEQFFLSSFGPSQVLPPPLGLGLLQLRVLICSPPPQLTGQLLHSPQFPQFPSTSDKTDLQLYWAGDKGLIFNCVILSDLKLKQKYHSTNENVKTLMTIRLKSHSCLSCLYNCDGHQFLHIFLGRDGAVVRALASHQCGPNPASYVGWVRCWFSTLRRKVFLGVFRFSPLLKHQHFQIPIRSWNARASQTSSWELLVFNG